MLGSGTLPGFTDDGSLPPGDYLLTLAELAESLLVRGPGDAAGYPNWDVDWRRHLVGRLEGRNDSQRK
jgi:hypothetical protein